MTNIYPCIRPSLIPLLFFLFVLAGCSSGRFDDSAQSFRTRITESGLKHFELRLSYARQERVIQVDPRSRTQRQRPSSHPETKREGERLVDDMKERLAKIMAQNDFCRDGYWVLKAEPFYRTPYIRGECHDLATPEDRVRYPDTLLTW